ncbi:MAG: hypothetical protein L3J43_01945, partial [Sulfurovum sp.]|nr:hypothetical protein [Sulfurovum sp.]
MLELGPDEKAKYPFLTDAGQYLKDKGFPLVQFGTDPDLKSSVEKAFHRLKVSTEGGIYKSDIIDGQASKPYILEREIFSFLIAIFLVVSAGITLLLLIPPMASEYMGKLIPSGAFGTFLFQSFSYASFYIPIYFIIAAVLLIRDHFKIFSSVLLLLSFIPFLTLALFFHVLSGSKLSLSSAIVARFGIREGAFLIFLVFLVEILVLFVIGLKFSELFRRGAVVVGGTLRLPGPSGSREIQDEEEGRRESNPETPLFFTAEIPDVPEFKKQGGMGDWRPEEEWRPETEEGE